MSSKFNGNLVKEAQNGNAQAFAELYEVYAEDMFRFAYYYLGSYHRAEDCVSDAVFSAFKKIPSLKKAESFESWLFKILRNCCNSALKEKYAQGKIIDLSEATYLKAEEGDLDSSIDLRRALSRLHEEEREIVILYYCREYTSREIAQIIGINHSTVRSKIRRATEKLRELLTI